MKPEYRFQTSGDPQVIRAALDHLDGVIQSMITDGDSVDVRWKPDTGKDPLEKITHLLQSGKLDDGILLLELFLSNEPADETILFNLGMAYSDAGELNRAIQTLRELMKSNPHHTHGHVALGVALLRARNTDEGLGQLQTAVSQNPDDPWAQRNLGAGLVQAGRFTEAVEPLRRATELSPTDQAAWFGLGEALQFSGDRTEADKAFIQTIALDEFSGIAERAREARTQIAEQGFHGAAGQTPRMDAVMYCLSALEKFAQSSPEQVKQIGFEIALLGTRGLDVNSPEPKYTLKNMEGKFSGLQLVCYEYVAFQQFAPTQDIGFDLSAEYDAAWKLFKAG